MQRKKKQFRATTQHVTEAEVGKSATSWIEQLSNIWVFDTRTRYSYIQIHENACTVPYVKLKEISQKKFTFFFQILRKNATLLRFFVWHVTRICREKLQAAAFYFFAVTLHVRQHQGRFFLFLLMDLLFFNKNLLKKKNKKRKTISVGLRS